MNFPYSDEQQISQGFIDPESEPQIVHPTKRMATTIHFYFQVAPTAEWSGVDQMSALKRPGRQS